MFFSGGRPLRPLAQDPLRPDNRAHHLVLQIFFVYTMGPGKTPQRGRRKKGGSFPVGHLPTWPASISYVSTPYGGIPIRASRGKWNGRGQAPKTNCSRFSASSFSCTPTSCRLLTGKTILENPKYSASHQAAAASQQRNWSCNPRPLAKEFEQTFMGNESSTTQASSKHDDDLAKWRKRRLPRGVCLFRFTWTAAPTGGKINLPGGKFAASSLNGTFLFRTPGRRRS